MNLFATTFLQKFTFTKSLQRQPLVDLPEYGDAPAATSITRTSLSTISSSSSSSSSASSKYSRSSLDPQVQIEIPLSPIEKKGVESPPPTPLPGPRRKTISRLGRTVLFYLVYFACLFSFLSLFLGAFFYLLSRGLVYLEEQHRASVLAEAQSRSAEAAAAAAALGDNDLMILDGSVSNESSSWSGIPLDVLEAP